MKEETRRQIASASRRLKAAETALETAKNVFAEKLRIAVEDEGESLGDVSRELTFMGRPLSRQRVHQVIQERGKNDVR